MCGVSGVVSIRPIDKAKLQESLESLKHRGPDAQGLYISRNFNCGLAHARLSILDTSSNANQPMHIEDNVIVYNGEIYNHLELRRLVEVVWNTTSDTETFLMGYIKFGLSFFKKLKGMFSGAILSEEKNELIIFRDSLGIKNLYYSSLDGEFIFSSEIKSLSRLISEPLKANDDAVKTYLSFENYPQGVSLFNGVSNLLPGEIVRIKFGEKIETTHFFYGPEFEFSLQGNDLVRQGKEIIERSVSSHLISDVPVGVYLSGGLDSALVATIASKKVKDLEAFTGYFECNDSFYDERYYARIVAKSAGIKINEIKITASDFIENFDKVIWHLDEPRMGMGAFSQFIVAREASKKRKVILAGHGGDELFAGYPMFKAFWLYSKVGVKFNFFKSLTKIKIREWIWVLFLFFKRFMEGRLYFAPEIFKFNHSEFFKIFYTTNMKKILDQLMGYYKSTYIPGLLAVEDKISMAHSLETRVPLWSEELGHWSSNISPDLKLGNGELKNILRKIARSYLPEELFNAQKRGFPTPLRIWFRNELKDFIRDRLCHPNKFMDKFVPLKERIQLVDHHISQELPFSFDEKRAHKIWMLLCLESWARQFKL
jgi:asparagine synthase (glutamine-hydrolysing)